MAAGHWWLMLSRSSKLAVAVLTLAGTFFAGMVLQALAERWSMNELRQQYRPQVSDAE